MISMKKIMVIGCPGSGKSTFSRALQEKTKLPLFYLDQMYWNEDRTKVERSLFLERQLDAINHEEWIIDGNFASTLELRMKACDTVFFLDYPAEVCISGVLSRRGKKREDIPWIESENEIDDAFMKSIREYKEKNRPEVMELLKKYSKKNIIVFQNREDANAFLELAN